MTTAFRAELRSARYTRSLVLVFGAALAATMLLTLIASGARMTAFTHNESILLTLFGLLIGVLHGATEYQHRTLQWTLLGTPRRRAAAAAKLVAAFVIGALLAASMLGAMLVVAHLIHGDVPLGIPAGRLVAGQLLLGALSVAFGVALGMTLQDLPAAVGAVFAVVLVVPLLLQVKDSLGHLERFLPFGIFSSTSLAVGGSPANFGPQLTTVSAAALLLAWTIVLWVLATYRFIARDS